MSTSKLYDDRKQTKDLHFLLLSPNPRSHTEELGWVWSCRMFYPSFQPLGQPERWLGKKRGATFCLLQKEASSVVQMSRRKPWAMPPAQGQAPPFGGHCGMAAGRGRASCTEATRGSQQASTAPSKAADEAWGEPGAPPSVLQRQLWVCGSDEEQAL